MTGKQLPEMHDHRSHPLQSLMRSFWGDDLGFLDESSLFGSSGKGNLSLSEDDKHVYVEANLAGLKDDEIDVTLDKGILWIRGEKKEEKDDRKYHHRAYKSYSYKISLPESVSLESEPEAKYDKGILALKFDKTHGAKAKKINIKSSK